MSYETDTAVRYRVRAARLRAMAKKCRDAETIRTIEWIAQEYELMARGFDDIDQAGLASIRARVAN